MLICPFQNEIEWKNVFIALQMAKVGFILMYLYTAG